MGIGIVIAPDIILKSNRKTLSLCVMKDGSVVVHAPNRASESQIERFVLSKQPWLASKIAIIENTRQKFSEVISGEECLFFGVQCKKIKSDTTRRIDFDQNHNIVVPNGVGEDKEILLIKNWYKKQAKEILVKRTKEIMNKIKLIPSDIKINDAKCKWGSCNTKGVVSFNWRVVMLEPAVIDYVIVHELCHLVEFNHSKKFWSLVNTFLSDAHKRKQKIKEYAFLLDMYRK